MSDEELFDIVSRWYGEFSITALDFQRLKVRYLIEQGYDPATKCTTCPDFPNEVQHHYRYYLRSIGLPVMSPNRKYILAPTAGSIRMSGEQESVTNATLTDERAEGILKAIPEMKEFIIKNPDYKAPAVKRATLPTDAETVTVIDPEKPVEITPPIKKKDEGADS